MTVSCVHRSRWLMWAWPLALAWLLSGCAAVTVSSISPSEYLAQRRGDVLTTGRLSLAAQDVLRVTGIDDCRERPEPCRQTLADAQGITDEQRMATLAELWLEHALLVARVSRIGNAPVAPEQDDPALDAWIETARHAYAYLFHTQRRPGERAFEDRQTQVRDYYNFATQQAVSRLFRIHQARVREGGSADLSAVRMGRWQIHGRVVDMGMPPGMGLPQELVAASTLRFSGLRNTYRRDGFGAEFVAVMPPSAFPPSMPTSAPASASASASSSASAFAGEANTTTTPAVPGMGAATLQPVAYAETQYPSVTALLHFEGQSLAEIRQTQTLQVLVYDPYSSTHAMVAGERVPLAANFSAGYGLWLARSDFAKQSLRTLFGLSDGLVRPVVQPTQPWNPQRRIVVMLHGLASSPEAWVNVANEVMGDETLRQNFQLWQVYYPTNAPLALNLRAIRQALQQTLAHFDPSGNSPATRDISLIGHSMGGVLARLLVSKSNEELWQLLPEQSRHPAERAVLQREGLADYLTLEPFPGVTRAIFIAAPHRGTPFAEERIARRIAHLVTLPISMLDEVGDLARLLAQMRPGAEVTMGSEGSSTGYSGSNSGLQRVPNSIDNLSDRDPFVRAAAALPMDARVRHHAIIGRIDPSVPLEQGGDGIVPYASAHLAGAQSERVIEAGHSVQEHPAAILEIRRILHEHLQSLSAPR